MRLLAIVATIVLVGVVVRAQDEDPYSYDYYGLDDYGIDWEGVAAPAPEAQCTPLEPPAPLSDFDPKRYSGIWYEIATTALARATFQQGCTCTTANYTAVDTKEAAAALGGRALYDVVNTCVVNGAKRWAVGQALQIDPASDKSSFDLFLIPAQANAQGLLEPIPPPPRQQQRIAMMQEHMMQEQMAQEQAEAAHAAAAGVPLTVTTPTAATPASSAVPAPVLPVPAVPNTIDAAAATAGSTGAASAKIVSALSSSATGAAGTGTSSSASATTGGMPSGAALAGTSAAPVTAARPAVETVQASDLIPSYFVLRVGAAKPTGPYDYALVAGPCRELLWVVSRTPTLAATTYSELNAFAKEKGFATDTIGLAATDQASCPALSFP